MEKKIFLRFCLYLGKLGKIKDLIQTVGFTVCSGYIKKKKLKMTSQLVIFRVFFFKKNFCPPTLNLKKKSCKSTNKKNLALYNALAPVINNFFGTYP